MVKIVANRMTFVGKGPFQITAPATRNFKRDLYWNGQDWTVFPIDVKDFATLSEIRDEMDRIENMGMV